MEDNIFVNIVAYAIVGALAISLIAIILAVAIFIIGKIAKHASKDFPAKEKKSDFGRNL